MNLKNLAKLLIIPMFTGIIVTSNTKDVDAKTKEYQDVVVSYYDGLINKDINKIFENSIDSRFDSREEYKNLIIDLINDNDPDVIIEKYEILDDGNPYDNKFKVREYYVNGNIVDVGVNVDFFKKKVKTGGNLEERSTNVKRVNPDSVTVTEEPIVSNDVIENKTVPKAITARWGGNWYKGRRMQTTTFDANQTIAVNYTHKYVSGRVQVANILYELRQFKFGGNNYIAGKSISGENTTAKKFYFNRTPDGPAFKRVYLDIRNSYDNTIKIAGESYN